MQYLSSSDVVVVLRRAVLGVGLLLLACMVVGAPDTLAQAGTTPDVGDAAPTTRDIAPPAGAADLAERTRLVEATGASDVSAEPSASTLGTGDVDAGGFRPEVNGFSHPNFSVPLPPKWGVYAQADGVCGGMVMYSRWYFKNKSGDQALYRKYQASAADLPWRYQWMDEQTAREVAVRAYNSIWEAPYNFLVMPLVMGPLFAPHTQASAAISMIGRVRLTRLPQRLDLSDEGGKPGHAILVYRWEPGTTPGQFLAYDPNCPGSDAADLDAPRCGVPLPLHFDPATAQVSPSDEYPTLPLWGYRYGPEPEFEDVYQMATRGAWSSDPYFDDVTVVGLQRLGNGDLFVLGSGAISIDVKVTLGARMTADPRRVVVYVDRNVDAPTSAAITSGVARVSLGWLSPGQHTLRIVSTTEPETLIGRYTKPTTFEGFAGYKKVTFTVIEPTPVPPPLPPGTVKGSVRDAVTGAGLGGVTVVVYLKSGQSFTAQTGADGSYAVAVPYGANYTVKFSKAGYVTEAYYGVVVESDAATYLDTVLKAPADTRPGTIAGRVRNADTGAGVPGLIIRLYTGIGGVSGRVVAATSTGSDGTYTIPNVPPGSYTAEVTGTGYAIGVFTVVSVGRTTRANQDATITPIGSGLRLVLYDFPSNEYKKHSGGGTKVLRLSPGFRKVTLKQVCFDDVGYVKVNGTEVFRRAACSLATCYALSQDVTALVHSGDNVVYGYADDCNMLSAQVVATFSVQ
jgi:hypothetical protein